MTPKKQKPILMLLLAALLALPAFAGERLTFNNSQPKILSLLATEGLAGGVQVDSSGRALGELTLDGNLGAFYEREGKGLQANLYFDGGKDVYRFKGTAECAGLVEVSWSNTVLEAQIISSIAEGKNHFVTQAVATSAGPTHRELFAVRGGAKHRIEIAFTGAGGEDGNPASFTQTIDTVVGCDQVLPIRIDSRDTRTAGGSAAGTSTLPRRERGDKLVGSESGFATPTIFIVNDPTQVCQTDDFEDGNLDGWTFSFIGDADQGSASVVGGKAQITSDGTTYYHVDDNGGFLHRPITGDFRAQIKLTGFPGLPTVGTFRKTSLTVRTGLGANDPRVTVQFIPKHPTYNTSAMQFDYRDEFGVEHELASTPLGVPLPNYLMIERRGSVFSGYYSTDGVSWVRPLGGSGNATSIAMPGTLEVGVMNASYSATATITAEFDDFKVCAPNVIALPPVPPHGVCAPGTPIDILYLLDSTGSMTYPFAEGGVSKLDAARTAIAQMNDLIEANLPGSRAALVTFQGGFTPAYNLNSAVTTLSHLTSDFDAVDAAAASINVASINPDATTPIAIALDRTYTIFQTEADPSHVPVVIFIGDGWPNIDMLGFGPSYYRFEELQAISIGAYLTPGQVAWLGNFNGPLNAYDGQVLADAMQQTLRLKTDIPNFLMFTLGVHSNATFRADLLGFMALYTGADFYDVESAEELIQVLSGVYNGLDCGADIGDRVWDDANGDGIQDPGEAGLEGVTVELVDSHGDVVDTQVTDANGNYLFENAYPGTYTVRVVTSTLPAGWGTETYDFDGIGTANEATVTVADDAVFLDADFGYRRFAGSIGDRVWNDADGDGFQDVGEAGLAGVTVELRDAGNVVIGSTVTDGNGNYSFTDLGPGTYTVSVVPATLGGTNIPTFDRDGVATANTATVVLAADQDVTDADFGYNACSGSIGDRVWDDKNGNGQQNSGETGISGVTVELLNAANVVIATTTTNSNGNYTFSGLPAGTYTVRIDPSTVPGASPTFDRDGLSTPHQATVTITCNQNKTNVDFGYQYCYAWVGDRVWDDRDGDGVQDGNEPGLEKIEVQLIKSNGDLFATEWTKEGGWYEFSDVPVGTYTIRIVTTSLPDDYEATYDYDGIATLHEAVVTLACDDKNEHLDFGYRNPNTGNGWCARTIGYWKNHLSEWPVTSLVIGGVTYNQTQLLAMLNSNSSDASRLLAKQLVAAMLNVAKGSDPWIQDIIDDANAFLVNFPPGSNPRGNDRNYALKLKDELDKYNNDPNCH